MIAILSVSNSDGLTSWSIRFASDQPPPVSLRLFRDGLEVDSFVSLDGLGETQQSVALGEGMDLEILDRDCEVPRAAFPGRFTLYWPWPAGQGSQLFRVDELLDVWTERGTIPDYGQGHFQFATRWLEHGQPHQFRVVPVFPGGLEAAAIPFAALMARRPDAPNVTFAVNGNRNLFIDRAA